MLILDVCPQRDISKKNTSYRLEHWKFFLLTVFDSKCYLYSSFLIKKLQRIFIQNNDIRLNRMLIIFRFKSIAKAKLNLFIVGTKFQEENQ